MSETAMAQKMLQMSQQFSTGEWSSWSPSPDGIEMHSGYLDDD